jgi:7-carboxy-7-deazaguanine synthase
MKINEIFFSIQGEGKWTGLPNIFLRCSGCNLRCAYCDTKSSYDDGKIMKTRDILNEIGKFPCKKICITGGEPLLQKEVFELIDTLIENNYEICLETNGSIDIQQLIEKKSLLISMDIKCPSSQMSEEMNFENLDFLSKNDQLKFIIGNKEDYEYAKKIIEKYKPLATIYFQPVWNFNPIRLSSWILEDGLDVYLGLQLHKIIWGDKKGV